MLKNDIFFLYPPGYSGNYLQWMIHASEESTREKTIRDPLLSDGTTHGFIRKPTHITLIRTVQWMLRNQPKDPQTYIINVFTNDVNWQTNAGYAVFFLMHSRPNCRFVNIYADTPDEVKYGALNTYTKWPTYFETNALWVDTDFDIWGANKAPRIQDRNHFYSNWTTIFPRNPKEIWEEVNFNVKAHQHWYNARHSLQPWEVNESEYTVYDEVPKQHVLNISLVDIVKENFVQDIYAPWMQSQNVGEFDWDHVLDYHAKYIAAQKNIRWFSAIEKMRQTKQVDRFLLETSLSQAFALLEIPKLQDGWQTMATEQLLLNAGYTIE